jgi:ferritin-like metal-binding protein YciE
MSTDVETQLVRSLSHAHVIEVQGLRLLRAAVRVAGADDIASVYRTHLAQTAEHERRIAERLAAHGEEMPDVPDPGEPEPLGPAAETPTTLAATAYALESHEIAVYRLLRGLAWRAGDAETVLVAERILEQEEIAAALVASTFERALDASLA